jgi:tetratricopeptide (TPR) repeat protein/transglutaminase-like putative cysteine protease
MFRNCARFGFIVLSSAFLLMSLALPMAAQPPATTPAPASEGATAASPAAAANFSAQAAVIEKAETIYRFEADGTGTKTERYVVRVQSEAGVQQLGTLRLRYSSANQKITISYARVRKPDGSVVTAPDSAVQDMTGPVARVAPMYTDYREKHVTVPALRPGDKLEYEAITETTLPLAPNHFWMEHDFNQDTIILDETLIVDAPAAREVHLKVQPDFKYTVTEENGRRVYTWKYSNLTTRSEREKAEREKNETAAKKKKKKRQDVPEVQLTTFASWSEMGKWYSKLEQERQQPSPEIKAKAEELTKGLKTDREKVRALYDYVALNYRYISLSFGVGRYQPHAAAEVFKNEYGDCKDKHTLLASMLRSLGYRPNTVLIHSSQKLDEDVPSPSQFDHVIGNVKIGNDVIWMDTTSEVAPLGMLVLPLRNKAAVQIAQDATTTIVRTPQDVPVAQFNGYELEGKVTEYGRLISHVKRSVRGDQEVALRSAFRSIPESHWPDILEYGQNFEGLSGKVTNVKLNNLNDTSTAFTIEYDVEMQGFFDWTAKDSKFALPVPRSSFPEVEEDATDPTVLGGPTVYESKVRISVPASVKLTAPLPVSAKRDFAEYVANASIKDGVLTASRTLRILSFDLTTDRAREAASFTRVLRSDEQQAVLAQLTGDRDAIDKQASSEEIEAAANNAFNARKYKLAIALYQQLTEKDPKHPRAWNNLGLAYLSAGQYSKSEAAYKKAIEVNPYDEYAYNNLGNLYMQQERWDDAMVQFRKQIEANPLDKFAHVGLGQCLVRARRYAEAVPELEAATQITPDNAFALQLLGEAYLKNNQTDKAVEVWDRAAEKQPEPIIWNNIAYVLACEKQRLDRAQQYAESAVSSTSALLKNLSPDQAEWMGAAVSSQLATYWDTLGWVYFQQGNYDKAEKYLYAAWLNTQHGEVGDHLGQLYEKRGQRDKAISIYADSLAGRRTVPETRDRLKAMGNDAKAIDQLANEHKSSLQAQRTIALNWPEQQGEAEVAFVLNGSGTTEMVKFLSGRDTFAKHEAELKALKLPAALPDDTTPHFVRKGYVSCAKGKCSLVLAPADESNLSAAPEEGVEAQ